MSCNWCRCGHDKRIHRGPNTECRYFWATGKNAVGVTQYNGTCPCTSFRPTSSGFWRRWIDGTEEWDALNRIPRSGVTDA